MRCENGKLFLTRPLGGNEMRSISGGYWGWRWLATTMLVLSIIWVPACGKSEVDVVREKTRNSLVGLFGEEIVQGCFDGIKGKEVSSAICAKVKEEGKYWSTFWTASIKSQALESDKKKNEMESVQVASLPEENQEVQGQGEGKEEEVVKVKRQTLRRQSPKKMLKRLQKEQEYVDEILGRRDQENVETPPTVEESHHPQYDPESSKKFPPMVLPDFETL